MFRLLMPPTNGMETDFWARFPENLWFEYYPTGGDFFEEHSLTLPVRPLPELRGEKKAIHAVPDIQKGGKRSYGKETEGNQVPALTLCPVSVSTVTTLPETTSSPQLRQRRVTAPLSPMLALSKVSVPSLMS